ncbi:MurT ligase domain-containing protein [Oenococcus alcoholitolerans]|uniref:MurT ligase domain-containing protein n=1 Tax=Oenococcus alcoholitolerans TaxID=931074 RepID=UPI003F7006AA
MTLRSKFALFTGTVSYILLHQILRRGGTSLPGKIAYKIDSDLLGEYADKIETVIISGTNGKTLTTALSARVLQQTGRQVITNPSGSNMVQGIFSTFLSNRKQIKNSLKKGQKPIAVLEVDEANVKKISQGLKPGYYLLTNIFRDQMDRYGEIYTTYEKITDGIKESKKAVVIANGDSPIFARKDYPNKVIYYGFQTDKDDPKNDFRAPNNTDGILAPSDDQVLHYHYLTYANLGDFFLPDGSFKRPELKYAVDKIDQLTPSFSKFEIRHQKFLLPLGGLYNIYNALAAYSLGKQFGLSDQQIYQALNEDSRIFGRQEQIKVGDHLLTIVLIKNPVGTNSVIDMMMTDSEPFSLVMLLNANYADGIDTSWIFDAEFEKLHQTGLKKIIVGGQRYKDFSVRMKMAGFSNQIIEKDFAELVDQIQKLPTKNVYVAATYTSMLMFRQELAKAGFAKENFR